MDVTFFENKYFVMKLVFRGNFKEEEDSFKTDMSFF